VTAKASAARLPDALTSLDALEGKILVVTVTGGTQVRQSILQNPSDPSTTAEIVVAEIGPPNVTVGDVLTVRITVQNTSTNVLKTSGPMPGFVYDQSQSYRRIPVQSGTSACIGCDIGGRNVLGTWRVAIGNIGLESDNLAYRWGLGGDLEPGARATITGQIRIDRYFEPTHFWAALIREPDMIVQNGVGMVVVTSLPIATTLGR
jgi:hypothetical protein